MKKGIALLMVAGMLASLAVPVSAAEQITTYKGGQELVLEEAGDVDITKEELMEKSANVMKDAEDLAMFMQMDVEANMSYDTEGTQMSMDMTMQMDMTDNKNDGLEYKSEKMNMAFFGMEMWQNSEEYIFPNAAGTTVSVKKEASSDAEEENAGTWEAEIVEEAEDLEEDLEDAEGIEAFLGDDTFSAFTLLDKKYTDGENAYYVLQGDISEVMDSGFENLGEMFGEIDTDTACYMVFDEEGMLVSLHIDLGNMQGNTTEEGVEVSFSKFLISMYTDTPTEITIPEDVQAAGDAAA